MRRRRRRVYTVFYHLGEAPPWVEEEREVEISVTAEWYPAERDVGLEDGWEDVCALTEDGEEVDLSQERFRGQLEEIMDKLEDVRRADIDDDDDY